MTSCPKEIGGLPMSRIRRPFYRRVVSLALFHGPIPEKFAVFCVCTGIGIVILGVTATATVHTPTLQALLAAMTVLLLVALVGFGVVLTRALKQPIDAMRRQIGTLASGRGDATFVTVTTDDEIGGLARDLNALLSATGDLATFKHVLEDDESVEDIYARLGAALEVQGVKAFQLYEVSNSKNRLRPVLRSGGPAGEWCSRETRIDCNRCRAKRSGEVVSSAAFPGVCKHFLPDGHQHVCVPMSIGGTIGGVMQFVFEGTDATEAEIRTALARPCKYINEALPVIEARRLLGALKESSVRDALTGLYNRRFVEEFAENLMARATRQGGNLGLIMCDLDHFKQVNDEHGHDAGDTVLREVAAVFVRTLRASDLAVRYGGEEFLMVLQDCGPETPMEVAERLRLAIEEMRIKVGGGTILRKTLSLGVAEFPTDSTDLWTAVKYADVALYRAKEQGRNRVVRFTPELWAADEEPPRLAARPAEPVATV
jgi:two-component system cell cycle response regulator